RRGEVASTAARKPFEVMVSAIISQRNRDEVTEKVAGGLLRRANTPAKMSRLGRAAITKAIRSANFYKTKAKHIFEAARMIVKDFRGKMPATRAELMRLPGVGGKTADIIMLASYGANVIPIDTHVQVVSQRLGWTKEKEPEKIRADLHKIFPPKTRGRVNILLVEFGKEFCRMHLPRCYACPVEKLCPYPHKRKTVL
ncbi:MAG: endonuclease III, partial [Candidatus Aenigmatarchaeota archaeon]